MQPPYLLFSIGANLDCDRWLPAPPREIGRGIGIHFVQLLESLSDRLDALVESSQIALSQPKSFWFLAQPSECSHPLGFLLAVLQSTSSIEEVREGKVDRRMGFIRVLITSNGVATSIVDLCSRLLHKGFVSIFFEKRFILSDHFLEEFGSHRFRSGNLLQNLLALAQRTFGLH